MCLLFVFRCVGSGLWSGGVLVGRCAQYVVPSYRGWWRRLRQPRPAIPQPGHTLGWGSRLRLRVWTPVRPASHARHPCRQAAQHRQQEGAQVSSHHSVGRRLLDALLSVVFKAVDRWHPSGIGPSTNRDMLYMLYYSGLRDSERKLWRHNKNHLCWLLAKVYKQDGNGNRDITR